MGFWARWMGGASAKAGPPAASADPACLSSTSPAPSAGVAGDVVCGPQPAAPQAALALSLLQLLPPPAAAASASALLVALDVVLAQPTLDPRWLPRAASLVPQLLRLLRQPEVSRTALGAKLSRDPVLVAEVLRMAQGTFYARRGPVLGLDDALDRLGEQGLQMAIARVLLRPLFEAERVAELAPLQAALQRHGDWQAEALAQAAPSRGCTPFDGYLAGLLHGAGWQALLRIVSQQPAAWTALAPDPELAQALAQRAHRLFGLAAQAWGLSPEFQAFAAQATAGQHGSALGQAWAGLQPDSLVLDGGPKAG